MESILYGGMDGISISKRESQLMNQMDHRGMVIFTPMDVRRFLKTSHENSNRIIRNMLDKGTIVRVERGKYILHDTLRNLDIYEIASCIFTPSYLSFWSALHFHSMTDQVPRQIFMATTRRKRPLSLQGQTIRYVTLSDRLFFGYQRVGKVVVSDPEKTIIDSLSHIEYSGGIKHIFDAISTDLDPSRLVEYCMRTRSTSIASRLGYIMETKGLKFRSEQLEKMITTYTKLDRKLKGSNPNPKWKLYVNREIT